MTARCGGNRGPLTSRRCGAATDARGFAIATAWFAALVLAGCGQHFASGDAPPTAGLILWLRADRGVTQQNGAVSQWADQSGAHSDAIQTESNLRPTFDHAALGGLGGLLFDGQDDFLKLPAGFADFSQGQSFFATFALSRDDTCTAVVEVSNGSEIDDIDFGRFNGGTLFEVFDQDHNGGPLAVGLPQVYSVIQHPDSGVQMRVNGADSGDTTIALPANITRQDNYVGNTLYGGCTVFSGHIGEILWYDRAVGDEELLNIEAYLGKHAGCCQ